MTYETAAAMAALAAERASVSSFVAANALIYPPNVASPDLTLDR